MAVVQGGAVHFIRTDHIHRPIFATNEAGAVVWQQSYDPFGRVISGSGSDMRFAGQWFAAENGLHQNWMRDYDATLGRYIQPDPLGLVDGASVYGYALGNLARWSDPRGEEAVGVIGGVVGSGIAAGGAVVGGGIATVIGILLIPSTMGDGTLSPEQMAAQQEGAQQCSPSGKCPPCRPYPAGTIGYRADSHAHNTPGVGTSHLNLYRVNQGKRSLGSTVALSWRREVPRQQVV